MLTLKLIVAHVPVTGPTQANFGYLDKGKEIVGLSNASRRCPTGVRLCVAARTLGLGRGRRVANGG
jgi:hypothetical protein